MVRALKQTLTLCLTLGLTSIALAQGQGRRQPPQPSLLGPLANPDVQKELKLSEEQIGKLKDVLTKVAEKYKDFFSKFQQLSPQERQNKSMAIIEDINKAIAGVLDAKQQKRFKQIQWQIADSNGFGALQDPDMQKELKLSDEQKKKLDGIFKDAYSKMEDMAHAGERSPEKYQAVLKDLEKKANDVLNEGQQKSRKELKGPPFQFSRPNAPRDR